MAISGERPLPYPGVPPKKGKDHGPSQKDVDAANAGQLAPNAVERFIQRLGKSRTVRVGAVAGTAGVGVYAYATNPDFHQTIDSAYHNLLQILGREAVVPPSFDNKADKGVIGDSNIQFISQEEAKKSNLQPVGTDTSLTFLFPFQLPEGTKVTYEKSLSERLPTQAIQTEAAQKGIKDHIDLVLPKDASMRAPVSGHVLAVNSQKNPENQNFSEWARVFYYDEGKDMTYVFWVFAFDESSGNNPFHSFVPTQENIPSAWTGRNWEKLPKIQQGEPILKTNKADQQIRLNIKAYKGKVVGPQAEVVDKTLTLVTPQFLTTTASGEQKLLVLTK